MVTATAPQMKILGAHFSSLLISPARDTALACEGMQDTMHEATV